MRNPIIDYLVKEDLVPTVLRSLGRAPALPIEHALPAVGSVLQCVIQSHAHELRLLGEQPDYQVLFALDDLPVLYRAAEEFVS